MTGYDPETGPDPGSWLRASESERTAAVREYCDGHEPGLPDPALHALVHSVVETQVALGKATPSAETLVRLVEGGLSRHEGIHAIGWVLSRHMFRLLRGPRGGAGQHGGVYDELRSFTADHWLEEVSRKRDQ